MHSTTRETRFFTAKSTILATALAIALLGCGSGGGGSSSSALASGDSHLQSSISAQVVTPEGAQVGDVTLTYTLTDVRGDTASITSAYSTDGGQMWIACSEALSNPQSEGTKNLTTSYDGTEHTFIWDSQHDLGSVNALDVLVRITPADATTGASSTTGFIDVVNAGTNDPDCSYNQDPAQVVLSADMRSGYVSYQSQVNHVVHTTVYGDGKVVFTATDTEDTVIHQGYLAQNDMVALLKHVAADGFWGWDSFYASSINVIADAGLSEIVCNLYSHGAKAVTVHGSTINVGPAGFAKLFDQLHYPNMAPEQVVSYTREQISTADLVQGFYAGEAYQKKLDTPMEWIWAAGQNGQVGTWAQN